MRKILILIKSFDGGGTEIAMLSLVTQLIKYDFDIKILCLMKKGVLLNRVPAEIPVEELKFENEFYHTLACEKTIDREKMKSTPYGEDILKYREINPLNPKDNCLYNSLLNKIDVNDEKYDMVLDFYGYASFLTAYAAKCVKADVKATWIHGVDIDWLNLIYEYLPYFNKIYCVSNSVKSSLDCMFPEFSDQGEVFFNMTDTKEILRKAEEITDSIREYGKYTLLSVGRLEKVKGFDYAVKAAGILKRNQIPFGWYIIGDGTEREGLDCLIKEEKVEDCVFLLGRKENVFPYIKQCDLYIQPSIFEGYSTTILEARVLKKIIIASDIPSNREQIQNGKNGYLTNVDPDEIADTISKVVNNEDQQKFIRKNMDGEEMDFTLEIEKLYNARRE